jgi:hypothetical protein
MLAGRLHLTAQDGDPSDAIARARGKAREMTRTVRNQCPLSEAQKAEIRKLLAAADRDAQATHRRL